MNEKSSLKANIPERSGPLDLDHYVAISALTIACELLHWIATEGGSKKTRQKECLELIEHIESQPRIQQMLDEVSGTAFQATGERYQ